jgi:uncharacterized repeat protein (TIGR01451 family)
MKGLAWKLATIAAVIGIGFLVLLQAQRGMNQALVSKQTDAQATPGQAAPAAPATTAAAKNPPEQAKPDAVADLPFQSEPEPASASKSAPGPAPAPAAKLAADTGSKSTKTAEIPTATENGGARQAANDPFSEFNDSKHPAPPADSKKSDAGAPLDLKPSSDIKQASASTEDKNSKPETPVPRFPTPTATAAATGAAQTASPNTLPILDLKAPSGQSEPGEASPPPSTADQKSGSKDSAGPQLFAPGNGPDLGPPPSGNQPQPSSAGPNLTPPTPAADNSKAKPQGSPPPQANADATPFPALDDEPASPAKAPAIPPDAGKPAPKTPVVQDTPATHPDPFPIDQAKELPLAKSPETKSVDVAPKTSPVPTLTNAPSPGPKLADASTVAVPQSSTRPAGDPHPESPPDFQGDGTVGEQAPLGPQRPQLSIEKVAPPNALIGQPLVYSIFVKNLGTSEARDVVVEDRIPRGTKLLGTMPRAELTGKRLIWRVGNIAPNDQRKISIKVIPLEAGEIGSIATVNFVSEAAAETVVTAPRIELELSAPKDVRLGQLVPFHFKVRNVGTGEARGIMIRDLIPEGLSHGAGNDLEYEVGRLPAGKSRELTLDLKAVKIGPTVNRAVVIGEGGLSVKAEAAIDVSGSKVVLSRSGPPRRYLDRPAIYSNTLTNDSKYDVEGVVVVETVPSGMEFAGASHGGQFNEGSRTIAWRIDRIPSGETCVVKSKLVPKATGTQTSTVRVSVPNGEPAEATSETVVEGFAALSVDVAGADGPVDVGEKVTLRINARNKGNLPATNVVVTVEIPEQMTILSVRGPGKHTQEGNQLQFGPMSTLEGRTAATCELVLQAKKRGDSRLHVSLRADQIDKPLTREESVLVLSESAEPSAAR